MWMRFLKDGRASVLPIFAIMLIPLVVAVGAVIDYSRAYQQRTVVQDAMDSAALASGKKIGLVSDTLVKQEATNFFDANVGTNKVTTKPTLVPAIVTSTITLTTQLHVPTYFLGMIGLNEFVFNLMAQSTQAAGTLEVAMALDNSGSMSGSKISTLKTAAADLANTLWGLGATSTKVDPIQISVVPFAGAVNVGPSFATDSSATWLDKTGVSPTNGGAMEANGASGVSNLSLFNGISNASWAGCVEARAQPYDATDDLATTGTPATMFVPMFAPDGPDPWTCSTSTCQNLPSTSATNSNRRYNGASTGGQNYNNYVPDVPSFVFTVSKAVPAEFTSNGHGLTVGTELSLTTTGSLYSGLAENTSYYVAAYGLAANNFYLSATSGGNNVTIAPATVNAISGITKANPGVVTDTSHGLSANTAIVFSTTGTLPSPLTAGTTYYVKTVQSSSKFTVSATSGGTAIRTTTAGSGAHSWSLAAPTVFTKNSHGLSVGNAIVFSTTGALPTGVSPNMVYYVKTVPNGNTFTISAISGGGGLVARGSQSGAHSFVELVGTSGSQSGTHSYTFPEDWTCQSGSAGCGGTGIGQSETAAFAGTNVSSYPMIKYGTSSRQVTASSVTVGGIAGGPNFMCTTPAITPLTTSSTTITTAINNLVASGSTNIMSGVMWAWRALSPTAPLTTGRAYSVTDNKKIIILMTDGENTYYPNSKFVSSWYAAFGYVSEGRLGTTSTTQSVLTGKMNERTLAGCTAAKTAGIAIYTVGFEINSSTASDPATALALLRSCATDTTKYYDAQNELALTAAFAAIGDDISQLRLSK